MKRIANPERDEKPPFDSSRDEPAKNNDNCMEMVSFRNTEFWKIRIKRITAIVATVAHTL